MNDDLATVFEDAETTDDPRGYVLDELDIETGLTDFMEETVGGLLPVGGLDAVETLIEEQQVLYDHVLPAAEQDLAGYEVVTLQDRTAGMGPGESGSYFGEQFTGDGEMPMLGGVWPASAYIVEEGADPAEDGYAAAIDPMTRTIEVTEDALYDDAALDAVVERWNTVATETAVPIEDGGWYRTDGVQVSYTA